MPPAARRPAAAKAAATTNGNPKVELFFDVDRETKGTFRFKEDSPDDTRPVMGSVYLRKDIYEQLGVSDTEAIKITIERDDSQR